MKAETSAKVLAIVNICSFAGTLVINGMANALPLNGKTTGEISDQYPNLFVPAGFTFSIWGVIYLMLAGFIIFQLISAFRNDVRRAGLILTVGPWFLISSLANMGWILAWHHEMLPLSLLLMGIIFLSLLIIYIRTETITGNDNQAIWLIKVPFSVYLGWITVASIANITTLLVAYGWNRFGLGEGIWAIVMVTVAGIIGCLILLRKGDIFFNLVLLWAFAGILVKRLRAGDPTQQWIILTVTILIVIISVLILLKWRRKLAKF